MTQKSLPDSILEIEEIDQANNVVATYIQSSSGGKGERIDVVVSHASLFRAFEVLNRRYWKTDLSTDSQEHE